jgi:hypothetical protein
LVCGTQTKVLTLGFVQKKILWGIKNVVSIAVEEAVENTKKEIAKRMLKRNASLEIIAANTSLTFEKIRAIAQAIDL